MILGTMSLLAQAPPQGINYQAVALDAEGQEIVGVDAAGQVIPEREIAVRFSIISGSANGTVEYIEEHVTNTDQFGLFDLVIGLGNPTGGQAGTFDAIDWGSGAHFLKVEIDIEGGINYKVMGTQQMMSVPYALYAATAGNASGGNNINWLGTLSADPTNPEVNDAYYNDQDGNSYIWDGSTWNIMAQDGTDGVDGVDGTDGDGITWLGDFATAPTSPSTNDAYYNTTDGISYIWDGSSWNIMAQNGADGTDGIDGNGITWLGNLATAPSTPNTNDAYYNTTDGISYIWDGSSWNIMAQDGSGGTGGNTLEEAYNEGGPGAGRVINAADGPIQINSSGGNTTGFEVNSSVPNSAAVRANNTGTGVALRAENTNASNGFAAIQANTNSTDPNNSAILGNNDGAGYGISGQIPATATGTAAVYGSNLRATGGSGVSGIGFNGVVGTAQNSQGFGLYGLNNQPGGTNLSVGTYGMGFNGIYGQTTDVTNGWSGYFTQDIGVDGAGYSIGGWNTVSDRRLKSNIKPIESALERLVKINGLIYTLRTPDHIGFDENGNKVENKTREEVQYGVLAQELEKVFPEMVNEKAVFINSGDETKYKTVNYNALIPVLIESIKELNEKIESLEQEVQDLKDN